MNKKIIVALCAYGITIPAYGGRAASSSKVRDVLAETAIVASALSRGRFDSSARYWTRDTLRIMADHLVDKFYGRREQEVCGWDHKQLVDPSRVKPGDIVLVHSDHFELFFKKIHPRISAPYVLLSHADPAPAPGIYAEYLNDPKILAWFGHDPDGCTHPKFHGLAIGLASDFWPHGDINLIKRIRDKYAGAERTMLAYLNISVNTYPTERGYVRELFMTKPFCEVVKGRRSYEQYLYDLAHTKFVISPRGNGIDCHRTWEAIIMGAIPVVRHSTLDPLFEGLPVLLIDDWNTITPEFLENAYKEIWSRRYDYSPLYYEYWREKILSVRDEALAAYMQAHS